MLNKGILNYFFILLLSTFFSPLSYAQKHNWTLKDNNCIEWKFAKTKKLPYADNIEMAGKKVAGIISYNVDTSGILKISRKIIYPQLHPFIGENDPNWFIYRAYLTEIYGDEILPFLIINEKRMELGKVEKIEINGILKFYHNPSLSGIAVARRFFPSSDQRTFIEEWTLHNTNERSIKINCIKKQTRGGNAGEKGIFYTDAFSDVPPSINLDPGDSFTFNVIMKANIKGEGSRAFNFDGASDQREAFIKQMSENLILETPIKSLNTLFAFSKIRGAENIFDSKLGPIHSPGGGRYYVGIWANDQAEYINPFFPYLGYDLGNESAMSTFRAFAKEINPEYSKIRYAFEIEGLVPPFLLDRGDAAMIAYGAGHFALANGNPEIAKELWPLIEWCLEYCNRQLNDEGVVMSESDEMEGRIETGNANLSTSSLYYGALNHATDLANSLSLSSSISDQYQKQSKKLAQAIEQYFGARIEGLDTYKYYKEHTRLRHWICLPLVVGIHNRKEATITGLFDSLWTENGIYVEKTSPKPGKADIFWDRGTLYALRGAFIAGEKEKSMDRLIEFTEKRLLGNRVPYVVEAYPEGSMAHLSAESGLYCRVMTEGLFGINPKGFKSFSLTPRLPDGWNKMSLKHIKAFEADFDITVRRKKQEMVVLLHNHRTGKQETFNYRDGQTVLINLE